MTAARRAIIETLIGSEGHISADDLAVKVRTAFPRVGRMTVYRTLEMLTELGLIRPIFQGTGAAHYILMKGGSHHHFICSRCNTVIEFENCTAGDLAKSLANQFGFLVQGHVLEVNGYCENCRTSLDRGQ